MSIFKQFISISMLILVVGGVAHAKVPEPGSQAEYKDLRLHTVAVLTSSAELRKFDETLKAEGVESKEFSYIDKSEFNSEVQNLLEEYGLKSAAIKEDLNKSKEAELILAWGRTGVTTYYYPGRPYSQYGPRSWRRYYYSDPAPYVYEYYDAPTYVVPSVPYVVPAPRYYYGPQIYGRPYVAPRYYGGRRRHRR